MTVKCISLQKRFAGGSRAGNELKIAGEPHLNKLRAIIKAGGTHCNDLLENELRNTSIILNKFEKQVPLGLLKQEDARIINKFFNDLAFVGNTIVYMLKNDQITKDHPLVHVNMNHISPMFNRLHLIVKKHGGVYKFLQSVKGKNKIFT